MMDEDVENLAGLLGSSSSESSDDESLTKPQNATTSTSTTHTRLTKKRPRVRGGSARVNVTSGPTHAVASPADSTALHASSTQIACDSQAPLPVEIPGLVQIGGPPLAILRDARDGCGGHLWQAALDLCKHLDTHPAWARRDFSSLRVLELGAGTALAGMYAARRGAKLVVCTDLDAMVPVMERNIALNFGSDTSSTGRRSNIVTASFFWGTDVSHLMKLTGGEPFDLILASDCVYLQAGFAPLLSSLRTLAVPDHTTIWLSYQHRRKRENHFFRRLWRDFTLIREESRCGTHQPGVIASGAAAKSSQLLNDAPGLSDAGSLHMDLECKQGGQPTAAGGIDITHADAADTAGASDATSSEVVVGAVGKSHKVQVLAVRVLSKQSSAQQRK